MTYKDKAPYDSTPPCMAIALDICIAIQQSIEE